MKKNLLFIFAALFIFSAQAQNTLKLMSYNIKNANGMDNVCNFQRIANVINNTSPDVVAIQEVDSILPLYARFFLQPHFHLEADVTLKE